MKCTSKAEPWLSKTRTGKSSLEYGGNSNENLMITAAEIFLYQYNTLQM
jgi:hypothetical protein